MKAHCKALRCRFHKGMRQVAQQMSDEEKSNFIFLGSIGTLAHRYGSSFGMPTRALARNSAFNELAGKVVDEVIVFFYFPPTKNKSLIGSRSSNICGLSVSCPRPVCTIPSACLLVGEGGEGGGGGGGGGGRGAGGIIKDKQFHGGA